MSRPAAALVLLGAASAAEAGDDAWYSYLQAERLEYQAENDAAVWEAEGWLGGDYRKFWWRTEGEAVRGDIEDAELQALYSLAVTAFFDLQLGARYEDLGAGSRISGVVALHGETPYRFETDTALFVTEDGDVLLRAEIERDFLVTQRLILQPRGELNAASRDRPEFSTGRGLTDMDLELRLRYEVHRKFAPYVGVSWQKALGETADLKRAAGEDTELTTLVAGIRFWF